LRTYRFRAHSLADPELYRSKEEVEQWKARDPITAFRALLQERGLLTDQQDLEASVQQEIEEAVAFAEAGAWEPVEYLARFVTAREDEAFQW
jgi:TPP-dependent pyruvate/acetoin dehydrogenase alpha subunit